MYTFLLSPDQEDCLTNWSKVKIPGVIGMALEKKILLLLKSETEA